MMNLKDQKIVVYRFYFTDQMSIDIGKNKIEIYS